MSDSQKQLQKQPLTPSLIEPDLEQNLKTLLDGFSFDGTNFTNGYDFLSTLQERYENKGNNISSKKEKHEQVEDIWPFAASFNEKRFWLTINNDKVKLNDGQKLVFQDGQSIIVNPGEYINGGFLPKEVDNSKDIDEFLYLYRVKKIDRPKKNYYVNIEGDYAIKIFEKPMVRFYFHLLPQKNRVIEWAEYIQKYLNRYRIPFQIKYPLHLDNYLSADNGVLYIAQNHFPLVAPLVHQVSIEFKDLFYETVPLLTLKLYDGIGFAEDPFFVNDSYGEHRRSLICKIIKDSFKTTTELNSDEAINRIIEKLTKQGYKTIYRNADTKYDYRFSKYLKYIELDKKDSTILSKWDPWNKLTDIFSAMKKKYNALIDDYGQKRFLNIAENYGKDLIEKAIWNPTGDSYHWLTYDKKNGEYFYRITHNKEQQQLKRFLHLLAKTSKDSYYSIASEKIKNTYDEDESASPKDDKPDEVIDLEELFKFLDSDADQPILLILERIQNEFDNITKNSVISYEDFQRLAKIIDRYFEKLSLPMKNSFGNYEYCPNYNGKLKIAVLFLLASSSSATLKDLLKFYQAWYKKNTDEAKAILKIWKSKFQPLTRGAGVDKK
ncbi:T3SS effector HopA1 family protein [Runella limosa]|uniref:T3SS effector HopA1 family protein n=1 Tax=Runella limosa TaxID=370978 RepID=UPI00048F7586|nr:T3SS effector HopA1 family protein [Runella limosa]